MSDSPFIVTTTNDVAGHRITGYLGIVRGLVVRTPNIGASILGGLSSILGGNISQFANVCEAARQEAYDLMVRHARAMGADAVIAMRYDATEFSQRATEVLAYGTAVKLAQA
jgi:uncharacterized protein YbjQ (UPF0145 family)